MQQDPYLSCWPTVGDCVAFGEYISKNIKLNELRNGLLLNRLASSQSISHPTEIMFAVVCVLPLKRKTLPRRNVAVRPSAWDRHTDKAND